MSERRHPSVVNVTELEGQTLSKGTRFGATRRSLGHAAGATKIGCTHYEVPPGKTAFPFHYHCVNDEALYVLEGEGTLRMGDAKVAIRAGDWINVPTGPAHAHQLINSGTTTLKYLCMSTLSSAEIAVYPDSKKVGAMAGASYGQAIKGELWTRTLAREGTSLDYYDGEDVGS
jgi:uncharacterized cupin superfamily protein